ncbi:MAG: folate family ECF transporter S component [Lawsonibacter sp.]|jgi:ECF transporter S component (folate family)
MIRIPQRNNALLSPLMPSYWRSAGQEIGNIRMIVFAALMIAMTRGLSLIPSIPIAHTKLSFGFLARALCALVCGPVLGVAFGFAEDMLGFILQPTGEFFFGYTLSTMAGVLVYALCFYRARITVWRLFVANFFVNILVNAVMGSVWTMMMRGGGYWGWFTVSFWKNIVTIFPKMILLYILFQALLPILQQMGVMPNQLDSRKRITWI